LPWYLCRSVDGWRKEGGTPIVVLFAGDLLWGISGMILAIPVLGIIKIVCDHIEYLQPFGRLLGENRPVRRWWSR
jgi:predicted PurR-regulated permease PerM